MYSVIETHLIETFVEVVRRGSVTEAARALDRSQPAISHRIRQLEEAFGTPLFEKVGRELQLTEAGERLVDEAVDLLERLRALPGRVSAPGAVEGTVTIGASRTLGRHLLLSGFHRVLGEHPEVTLIYRPDDTGEMKQELLAGRIDVLFSVGEIDSTGLEVSSVGDVTARVGMSPQIAPEAPPGIEELRALKFLGGGGGTDPLSASIHEWAIGHGMVDEVTPRIPDVEAVRELAAMGAGYVVLPEYAMHRDEAAGRLVTFDTPLLDRRFPLLVAVRSGRAAQTAADAVRSALLENLEWNEREV